MQQQRAVRRTADVLTRLRTTPPWRPPQPEPKGPTGPLPDLSEYVQRSKFLEAAKIAHQHGHFDAEREMKTLEVLHLYEEGLTVSAARLATQIGSDDLIAQFNQIELGCCIRDNRLSTAASLAGKMGAADVSATIQRVKLGRLVRDGHLTTAGSMAIEMRDKATWRDIQLLVLAGYVRKGLSSLINSQLDTMNEPALRVQIEQGNTQQIFEAESRVRESFAVGLEEDTSRLFGFVDLQKTRREIFSHPVASKWQVGFTGVSR